MTTLSICVFLLQQLEENERCIVNLTIKLAKAVDQQLLQEKDAEVCTVFTVVLLNLALKILIKIIIVFLNK